MQFTKIKCRDCGNVRAPAYPGCVACYHCMNKDADEWDDNRPDDT